MFLDYRSRFLFQICAVLLWLLSAPSQAGLFDKNPFADTAGPLEVEKAFVFSYQQEGNKLQLLWTIPDDYYLYRDRIEVKGFKTTRLQKRVNAPAEQKDDPLFGKVWVYHNFAEVILDLSSVTETVVDDRLQVTYQGCWEGGICYPPVTKEVVVSGITAVSASLSVTDDKESDISVVPNNQTVSEQDQFAQMLGQGSIVVTLGAFFLAGLALSFTPCVFPMIPILSSIIAGQGKSVTARKGLALSLVYVLAVSVTYTIAGIIAGLFGENVQALFQNAWIIGFFSLIFVLLALAMFGFYELQLPAGLQARLSDVSNRQKGGTMLGVAIMGFLSALIVGPCMAAPLAGALLYIGQTGDPVLGGAALFALSIGMGVPLLIVGASAGKFLPHAGAWMNRIKEFFGVLLLLMAIWMLDRIIPVTVTMWLAAVVLLLASVYMGALNRLDSHSSPGNRISKGVGIIVLLYSISLMAGALGGNQSFLYPLKGFGVAANEMSKLSFEIVKTPEELEKQLQVAQAQQTPVMLDFYADWCVSCIELEVYTFADQRSRQALERFKLIKVDVTANDEAAKRLNKQYSLIGPPALIFYNATGDLLNHKTLIGVVDPTDFVNHISEI